MAKKRPVIDTDSDVSGGSDLDEVSLIYWWLWRA